MARGTIGLGLTGLFVVFLVVLIVLPYISRMFPTLSGFQSMGETEQEMEAEEGEEEGFQDMSCTPGLKPCPEGYFCEQNTCVPILPRYNINTVVGVEDQV
jgi:hypothetical protein